MPPPVGRPTLLLVTRASIVDEKKRQERVAAGNSRTGRPQPPVDRPTSLLSTRTSIVDEKKRQERDAACNDQPVIHRPPPPVSKPAFLRDSIFDEQKRQERVAAGNYQSGRPPPPVGRPALLSATRVSVVDEQKRQDRVAAENHQTGGSSKAWGTSVYRIDAKTRSNNALQTEKGGVNEDKGSSGEVGGRVADRTGTRNVSTNRMILNHPTASVPDTYGYTRISVSQARLCRDNLDFYQNKIYSKPAPGHTIEDMLKWKGDYSMLERNRLYIQWLFPIAEGNGLNLHALYEHEAQGIRDDNAAHKRVLKAYKMMLDFYGMQVADSVQGTVKRANKGWEERYCHLNRSRHNFVRITRILKSIGELGFERLQAPWVDFLIEEAVVKKVLPNLNGPCLMEWIMAVKDNGEREMLYRKASGMLINQSNVTYGIDSESDDGDEEEDEVQIKGLDPNGTEMSRLTLESSENQHTTTYSELLKHVDTASAVNAASVSKQKDRNPAEKHVKDKAEATLAKAKSTSGAESASAAVSKQKHEIPNEKPAKDTTDITLTAEMKTTGATAFGKKAIRNDDVLSARVLEAFRTMLDFYGMRLCDDVKGKFKRIGKTYEERYDYLQRHRENYMRITRILISIGELGLERFQVPWIDFLISEGIDSAMFPTIDEQCIQHWISAIKDEGEQHAMFRKYQKLARHL